MWDIVISEKGNRFIHLDGIDFKLTKRFFKIKTIEPDGTFYWFCVNIDDVIYIDCKKECPNETKILQIR